MKTVTDSTAHAPKAKVIRDGRGKPFAADSNGHIDCGQEMTAMEVKFITTDGRDDSAAKQRLSVLTRNRELMEHHFVASKDKDIAFVIWELTADSKLPDDVKAFVVRSVESSMIPTQVVQGPRWSLYKALRNFQRSLHRTDPRDPKESRLVELLARPAKPNHFWAVVIACRGKQVVEYPAPVAEGRVQT